MAEKKAAAPTQLDAVLAQIRKEFGETAILRMGDAEANKNIAVISGVGVREYFQKFSYKLVGSYMIKRIAEYS